MNLWGAMYLLIGLWSMYIPLRDIIIENISNYRMYYLTNIFVLNLFTNEKSLFWRFGNAQTYIFCYIFPSFLIISWLWELDMACFKTFFVQKLWQKVPVWAKDYVQYGHRTKNITKTMHSRDISKPYYLP